MLFRWEFESWGMVRKINNREKDDAEIILGSCNGQFRRTERMRNGQPDIW